MIKKIKSLVYGIRNAIQDAIEAKQAMASIGISAVLQPLEQPKHEMTKTTNATIPKI